MFLKKREMHKILIITQARQSKYRREVEMKWQNIVFLTNRRKCDDFSQMLGSN